jgi:rSAM/selenodomain-associated transferase 2
MLVSVVIPTLNEAQAVRGSVRAAQREYQRNEVEVVVADGGSTDGTLEHLSPDVVAVISARGRGIQMNAGARASRGRVLVFCHADTLLPAGWRPAVLAALRRPCVVGGVFRPLFLPARGVLRILNLVPFPRVWWLMYGDQVQFVDRGTFERVGGFPESPLMEDMEIMRTVGREGRLVRLPMRVSTSSRRFLARGPLRQLALNAALVFAHLILKRPVEGLARHYYARPD